MLALVPGNVFAEDFRIVRPLAEGGMGSVYVVEQISTGVSRALKLMQPQLVKEPKLRQRFEQEARVGGRIRSDHVVQVVGAGVEPTTGAPWLAMELLEGEDLASHVARRGRLPVAEVTAMLTQLCHALSAAHAEGIVHRDLKPENIFLGVSRTAGVPFMLKVLDFGIAKVVAEAQATGATTGAMGTPLWMAPEQAESGRGIRPTADVWALGLIAFRLLTGVHYWREANRPEPTVMALMKETLLSQIEPPSNRARELTSASHLPPWFDEWFGKCVHREPEGRHADAGVALREWLRQSSADPLAVDAAPTGSSPRAIATQDAAMAATQPSGGLSPTPGNTPAPLATTSPPSVSRRRTPLLAVIVIGMLAVSGAAVLVGYRKSKTSQTPSDPRPVAPAQTSQAPVASASASASASTASLSGSVSAAPSASLSSSVSALASAKPPTAKVSEVVSLIQGRLPPEVVKRIVRANFPRFRSCYEQGLKRDPMLKGTVITTFTIDAAGSAVSVGSAGGTLGDAKVGGCVAGIFRTLSFPEPEGGSVLVTYTLDFKSE